MHHRSKNIWPENALIVANQNCAENKIIIINSNRNIRNHLLQIIGQMDKLQFLLEYIRRWYVG